MSQITFVTFCLLPPLTFFSFIDHRAPNFNNTLLESNRTMLFMAPCEKSKYMSNLSKAIFNFLFWASQFQIQILILAIFCPTHSLLLMTLLVWQERRARNAFNPIVVNFFVIFFPSFTGFRYTMSDWNAKKLRRFLTWKQKKIELISRLDKLYITKAPLSDSLGRRTGLKNLQLKFKLHKSLFQREIYAWNERHCWKQTQSDTRKTDVNLEI